MFPSLDYKNQLKQMLSDTSQAVDDLYHSIRNELENEILGAKQTREDIDKETNELYDSLDDEKCVKIIKNKMPWRIKLFNKIECHGRGIKGNGRIMIYFTLNNDIHNGFECVLSTEEIKKLLK